jgi:hypothetical protein
LLAELGYSDDEIRELAGEGTVLCDPPIEGQKSMASPWGM